MRGVPTHVRTIARKHNLPIGIALLVCELVGIGGARQ